MNATSLPMSMHLVFRRWLPASLLWLAAFLIPAGGQSPAPAVRVLPVERIGLRNPPETFSSVYSAGTDPSGNFIVNIGGTDQMYLFSPDGSFIRKLWSTTAPPYNPDYINAWGAGFHAGKSGFIHLIPSGSPELSVFHADGSLWYQWTPDASIKAVTATDDDMLHVLTEVFQGPVKLKQIAPPGKQTGEITLRTGIIRDSRTKEASIRFIHVTETRLYIFYSQVPVYQEFDRQGQLLRTVNLYPLLPEEWRLDSQICIRLGDAQLRNLERNPSAWNMSSFWHGAAVRGDDLWIVVQCQSYKVLRCDRQTMRPEEFYDLALPRRDPSRRISACSPFSINCTPDGDLLFGEICGEGEEHGIYRARPALVK